ncbi:hypothetical protein [Paraconexibacter sp.]|uniref:hypothetical protein n=1 Tax=Paraconexibacter sp. TaxID=2949640 RepID=UPI0035640A5B
MDVSSSTSPLGALDALSEATGVAFPNLSAARARTAQRLYALRGRLQAAPPTSLLADQGERHSIVLFGSWGRSELTGSSDDDWALVADGAPPQEGERDHLLAWVGDAVGGGTAAPGAQGLFGTVVSAESLAAHIGLEGDSNRNLTRRILLLLESVPATGADVHARAIRRVLDAYLHPSADGGDHKPPRFLLNDLVRYWRTIAVDFEGKHRASGHEDPNWVMRNAKLRLSRKMLFAGGLVPVLLCRELTANAHAAFLAAQFAAPPTDRLAAAYLSSEAGGIRDTGARTLAAYDRWVGLLADPDARREIRGLRRETREHSAAWREVRELGAQFEAGLLALLFGTELAPVSQQYLVF